MQKVRLSSEAQQAVSGGWIHCAGINNLGLFEYEIVEDVPCDGINQYYVMCVIQGNNIIDLEDYAKLQCAKYRVQPDELTKETHQIWGDLLHFKTVRDNFTDHEDHFTQSTQLGRPLPPAPSM